MKFIINPVVNPEGGCGLYFLWKILLIVLNFGKKWPNDNQEPLFFNKLLHQNLPIFCELLDLPLCCVIDKKRFCYVIYWHDFRRINCLKSFEMLIYSSTWPSLYGYIDFKENHHELRMWIKCPAQASV